jgi:CheY-like chemotaxis protein
VTELAPLKARILVVDDEPYNRYAFSKVLEDLDEEVVLASSGEEALRYLLHNDCAVILLDVTMPELDGYETATLIRKRERSRQIPIIFISAIRRNDEHIAKAYTLGAVDYVFKPVDPVILRSKISVFVDLYKKSEEIRRQGELERLLLEENLAVRAQKLEAERALRRAEERQALIVRSLPIAVYSSEVGRAFVGPRFVSEHVADGVGYCAGEFVDDPGLWVSRIHPGDLERVLTEVLAAAATGSLDTEYRWRCADGSERVFLDRGVVTRDDSGMALEIFGSCLDITARRQVEQQLFQSQKMEAVGQLTGGLAHDFNNMLTVVIGNLDSLAKATKGTGRDFDRTQMALTGALSCAELTRRLLAFARRQPLRPEAVDFSHLIYGVTKLLHRTLGESVAIDVDIVNGLWYGMVDPVQLESALMNLCVNARDAMPNGGRITIEAHNTSLTREQLMREVDLPAGEFVMLRVSDTGLGMTPEVAGRAFEPFYTTKHLGHGSGLGLSMVYGFAKQSGGHVKIDSTIGEGTSVRLYLPRTDSVPSSLTASSAEAAQISGHNRMILLVEDDAGVRAVTAAALKELQFQVIEAASGHAALEILRNGGAQFDLLFTDIVMPGGISGLQLATEARNENPDLRVLFTSGYSNSYCGEQGELLPKPYRQADLVAKLAKLLPREALAN